MFEWAIKDLKRTDEKKHVEFIPEKNYKSEIINEESVKEIKPKKGNLAFVDGGIAILFKTSQTSIGIIRTAATLYKNNKRTKILRTDYEYIVKYEEGHFKAIAKNNNEEIKTIFPLQEDLNRRTTPEAASNWLRTLIEVKTIQKITKEWQVTAIRDGNLHSASEPENKILIELPKETVGVAKTHSLITKDGSYAIKKLLNLKKKTWYARIQIPTKTGMPNIGIAKLNHKTKHILRIEWYKNIEDTISILASLSADPTITGYPYPLIITDKLAKISKSEERIKKETVRTLLKKEGLADEENSTNMHEIMDRL